METDNLGSKKINNKQTVNEGFSGENISGKESAAAPVMHTEVEIDLNGKPHVVQRAHNVNGTLAHGPEHEDRNLNENENLSPGMFTEAEDKITVENKDRNSDITANRYPNSAPDNHKNRGNIKLDEK